MFRCQPQMSLLRISRAGRRTRGAGWGLLGRAGPGRAPRPCSHSRPAPPASGRGRGRGAVPALFAPAKLRRFFFLYYFFFLSPPLNLLTVCFFPAWRRRGFRVVSRHDDGRCSSHPLTGRGESALKIPKKNLNPPKNPVNAAAAAQRSAGPRSFKAGPQQSSAGGASSGGDVNTARGGGAAIRIWLGFKRERGSSGAAGCAGLPASPALRR